MYFLVGWPIFRLLVSGRVAAGTQFHGGLVQITTSVLFMGDGCRFQPLIFQGVNYVRFLGGVKQFKSMVTLRDFPEK